MAEKQTTEQTDAKGEGKTDADGEPLTLTKAELQKLIDDNRAEAQTAAEKAAEARLADKERKRHEAAERAKEEEKGEFDKVKLRLEAERDAERLTTKRLEARIALRDYLAADEKRSPYAKSAEWIEKAVDVTAETEAKDLPGIVKTAADKFIADNPREAPKPGPGGGARGREDVRGRAAEAAAAKEGKNGNAPRAPSIAEARF